MKRDSIGERIAKMTREDRATRIDELPAPMRQHLHELDDEEEAIAQATARERWVVEID